MEANVIDRVRAAIASARGLSIENVPLDALLSDIGLDSLDSLNVLFELEESCEVSIPDLEARAVRSVGDVVRVVQAALERDAQSGPAASGPAQQPI